MRKEKTAKTELENAEKVRWGDLLGFEKDKALLRELVREERLPNVLLFEGREGIGKSSLLFFLAALHFCEREDACGHCGSCQMLASNQHPDLLLVRGDGESLKVSSISDISEFIGYAPQASSRFARRLVLIIDAEHLTTAAVNKLLKTLEEPSASARILISTSRMRHLLATLLSRCVHWHLRPPSVEDVEVVVERKAPASELSKKELRELITRFGNSPSKVLRFLERKDQANDARNLVQCRKVGDILTFAETFKQSEINLSDFIPDFEYALNALYRELAKTQDASRLGNIKERRAFLRELKELVNKHKIALNPQMVVEKLGFFNLQLPVRSDGRG